MNSLLKQIVNNVLEDEKGLPMETPLSRETPIDLSVMADNGFFLIAEAKRNSPSKGILRDPFKPVELACAYQQGGASAVSVVTEKHFFGGLLEYLPAVKAAIDLPVLRKDFIVTQRQVIESYNLGADMLLLITACLEETQLAELHKASVELGLTPIVEVHDPCELEKALAVEPSIIGINNRNLNDFSVDTDTTLNIAREIPEGISVISESGIFCHQQIRELMDNGITGALVGESLLKSSDPALAVRKLLHE